MTDMNTNLSDSRHVTAFFDSREDAEAAIDRIVAKGIARDDIRMVAGRDDTTTKATEERGFFEALGDFFMPDDDRAVYAEGLERGGYLVSLDTTADMRDDVLDILDDEGTVDMDAREESWRADGWTNDAMTTGAAVGADPVGATPAMGLGTAPAYAADMGAKAEMGTATPNRAMDRDSGQDDGHIDVMEERLKVGKREVDHGRVRVRSYVVETPVEEEVSLHGETVRIDRRTVDRAIDAGADTFADRTIEAVETSEEAVVSKEARVVEEISLTKTGEDRTETVKDTVRHTEVEVEDPRDTKAGTDRSLDADRTKTDRPIR